APVKPGTESSRKLYRITDKGQRSLDDFITVPPSDAPRPLRQELAVKLLFAGPDRLHDVLRLIDHQRETYMRELTLLGVQRRRLARRGVDAFVTQLLIDGAELNVRAELAWLDEVTAKLTERLARSPRARASSRSARAARSFGRVMGCGSPIRPAASWPPWGRLVWATAPPCCR